MDAKRLVASIIDLAPPSHGSLHEAAGDSAGDQAPAG